MAHNQIIVIDTKLVSYSWSFYARREITNVLNTVFNIIKNNGLKPTKIIWASDKAHSFRSQIAPEYKANRKDKFLKDPSTILRKEAFDYDYNNLIPALVYFGNSLFYPTIEADDIANIIASSTFENDDEIILLSSDRDWASMLYSDRVKLLHLKRNTLYTRDDIALAFGQYPIDILIEQVFCGSGKENILGLKLIGKGRFKKLIDDYIGKPREVNSIEDFVELFNTRISTIRDVILKEKPFDLKGKSKESFDLSYRIPAKFKESTDDVVKQFDSMIAMNTRLFTPIFLSYLQKNVADTFKKQLTERKILKESMLDLITYGISYSANVATYDILKDLTD